MKQNQKSQESGLLDILSSNQNKNNASSAAQDQIDLDIEDDFGEDLEAIDINFQLQDFGGGKSKKNKVSDEDFEDEEEIIDKGEVINSQFQVQQQQVDASNYKKKEDQRIQNKNQQIQNAQSNGQIKQSKQAIKDDFDDEFDYDNDNVNDQQNLNQQKLVTFQQNDSREASQKLTDRKDQENLLKGDFKKFLPTKQEMKKKNYIGDAIIAERNEQDENEDDNINIKSSSNRQDPSKPSYLSKFSKITQIFDESTKDYKIQQKEMGIKRAEEAIISKAKLEMHKIEEFKAKFIQSAFGGVITNQLSSSLDRIKTKHSMTSEQLEKLRFESELRSERLNNNINLENSREVIEAPLKVIQNKQINKIVNKNLEQNKNDVKVEADLEDPAKIIQSLGKQSKKKKKKGKKIKKIERDESDEDKESQLLQDLILHASKQNQQQVNPIDEENVEENFDNLDGDGNATLSNLIQNQIQSQSQKKQIHSDIQKSLIQQNNDGVDWEALNKMNKKINQQNQQMNQADDDEQMKIENVISYRETQEYFQKKADLRQAVQEVEQMEQERIRNAGFFSSITSCIFISKLQNQDLVQERKVFIAISRTKFNYEVPEHVQILKSIYKKLMKNSTRCPTIGNHWVDIGFQRSDPSTDIRGGGMAGLVQALYFIETYNNASQLILDHSRNQKTEFPLLCQMLEFSVITLRLLKEMKLNKYCNKEGNVIQTTNSIFSTIFLKFCTQYIENGYNIIKLGELTQLIEREAKTKLDLLMRSYYKCNDKQATSYIKQSYKDQKARQEEKLRMLAQQSEQFQIQRSEYVNQRENKERQNFGSNNKAKNYQAQDDGVNQVQQQNKQSINIQNRNKSEFSEI